MLQQTVYLIRHAESTMSGRYCGSINAPLSLQGLRQVKKLSSFFNNISVDLCFFSDLKRARQTSQSVKAALAVPARPMREICFGEWEGRKYDAIASRWPKLYDRWLRAPQKIQIPAGEPFDNFFDRVGFFASCLKKISAPTVAVVAHGGSLSVLNMILLGRPLGEFWKWVPSLSSISILKRNLDGASSKFKLIRPHFCPR